MDMMHGEHYVMHKRDNYRKVDVVEVPFKGHRFGLVLVLPHAKNGVGQLEAALNADGVDHFFQNLTQRMVSLSIPKFKIESTLNLVKPMINMGMKTPFNNFANFTGISSQGITIF